MLLYLCLSKSSSSFVYRVVYWLLHEASFTIPISSCLLPLTYKMPTTFFLILMESAIILLFLFMSTGITEGHDVSNSRQLALTVLDSNMIWAHSRSEELYLI